jgi:hypothetical protein
MDCGRGRGRAGDSGGNGSGDDDNGTEMTREDGSTEEAETGSDEREGG